MGVKEFVVSLVVIGGILMAVVATVIVASSASTSTSARATTPATPLEIHIQTCAYEYNEVGDLVKSVCFYDSGGDQ